MNDDQRDNKPTVDTEPAAKIIEQWIKLREAQGWTREAAIAELNAVSGGINVAPPEAVYANLSRAYAASIWR